MDGCVKVNSVYADADLQQPARKRHSYARSRASPFFESGWDFHRILTTMLRVHNMRRYAGKAAYADECDTESMAP
jgi:hypothetical protein